jgi:hypothetical protein
MTVPESHDDPKSHNDNDVIETVWPKETWSLDRLEAALKKRIGWVDEVVSPFARLPERALRSPDQH